MDETTLAAIHIHPVKSCRRIEVDAVAVTELGLADDRMWQVVDDKGHPVTQRHNKLLAAVQPALVDGGLRLSAPGVNDVEVAPPGQPNGEVKSLFGVTVASHDAGDEVATWFSDLLGLQCRLAAVSDGGGWRLPDKFEIYRQPMAFSDAAPVLVTTTSSLGWLQDNAEEPFGMERFRPNLVVENNDPWAEDTWADFSIGGASLTAGMPWPRCAIPQIDQDSVDDADVPRHKEPAKVLRAHRWCTDASALPEAVRPIVEGSGLFGIGCTIGPAGTVLRVGDRVQVHTTADPLIAAPNP